DVWKEVDACLLPTTPTIYRLEEVEASPVELNSNLGYYTNFMNLLDFAAVAVPAGFRGDGLPLGVTLFAPAFSDEFLLESGDELHRSLDLPLGTSSDISSSLEPLQNAEDLGDAEISLAVCGAHLEGFPLHHQLTSLDARLLDRTRTSNSYRFFHLKDAVPPKPGLVRSEEGGAAIEVEVYALRPENFGRFVSAVPRPLVIGKVELADGTTVSGFLCEPEAVPGSKEITHLGSWRQYMAPAKES
ncbi:MAG: amidase family protein, partial [Verrucomicrobiota bacterium]